MKRVFHLDLKGCPPTPECLIQLPCEIRSLGYDTLLVEWEGMFPWTIDPELRSAEAYSFNDLHNFFAEIVINGLEYIPLIQSLGHLEFILSKKQYKHLREMPRRCAVLHPLGSEPVELICSLIDDVLSIGPKPKYIHLGGDEASCLGRHSESINFINTNGGGKEAKARLYLQHMSSLFVRSEELGIQPILWSDMMEEWPAESLCELSAHADLMVWGYDGTVDGDQGHHHRREIFEKFIQAEIRLWGATAFRGADGFNADFPILNKRIENASSWYSASKRYNFKGIVATGWTRYDAHRLQVCPLDACWDAVSAVATCMHGETPSEVQIAAKIKDAGLLSRFESTRVELMSWSEVLSQAWTMARVCIEQLSVEDKDKSRSGSHALDNTINDLGLLIGDLSDSADSLLHCLSRSICKASAEAYVQDRLLSIQNTYKGLSHQVEMQDCNTALDIQNLPNNFFTTKIVASSCEDIGPTFVPNLNK